MNLNWVGSGLNGSVIGISINCVSYRFYSIDVGIHHKNANLEKPTKSADSNLSFQSKFNLGGALILGVVL